MIGYTHAGSAGRMSGEQRFALSVALGQAGFEDPDPEKVFAGLREAAVRRVPAGEVVIRQGDMPDFLYIVHKGNLLVTKDTADGRTMRLGEIGEGGVFGEMSLLTGQLRSATVSALDDCELFVLSLADFRYLLSASPAFEYRMRALAEERRVPTAV